MGKCSKCSMSPRGHAISSFFWSGLNLALVIFGVAEKMRWTPFHQEMECETPPPMAMRLSKLSMPSPLAESMFMQPGTAPFGLYINMTTRIRCTNPGQSSITMRTAGSDTELLAPNMSDLAIGGYGLPFTSMGKASLSKDAHFALGGGQGEMVTDTQIAWPLADVLASMSPVATMTGYSPSFTRSSQVVETCASVLGLETCTEAKMDQFCGSYGGSCFVEAVDAAGEPLAPVQLEPAICGYTRMLCGKEADVLRQMKPEVLGIQVLATMPCAAPTGLPNGTLCNVISAPGIDPSTRMPLALRPAVELTPEAQEEKEELLAQAEAAVEGMLLTTIILNAFFLALNLSMGFFCCRRHYRAQATEVSGISRPPAPPTLMTSTTSGNSVIVK
eukprot:gb/GFBE01020498.1/.p1 GENE.gb/GFBE01020498.1/~~gb/GFBE01020498.1/.p1  ORF type:complete len:388 (+),score=66.82 gb/GFBE01020498.1/:1-1164(+)